MRGRRIYKLLSGTTLENAKEYGAVYVDYCSMPARMLSLPAHIICKLGYIPSVEETQKILDQKERVDRFYMSIIRERKPKYF